MVFQFQTKKEEKQKCRNFCWGCFAKMWTFTSKLSCLYGPFLTHSSFPSLSTVEIHFLCHVISFETAVASTTHAFLSFLRCGVRSKLFRSYKSAGFFLLNWKHYKCCYQRVINNLAAPCLFLYLLLFIVLVLEHSFFEQFDLRNDRTRIIMINRALCE